MNGKSYPLAVFSPFDLKRCGGAHGGIECQVIGLARRGARLDIAPAFALGARARAAPGTTPDDFVERRIEAARIKNLTRLDLLAALPPVRIAVVENLLLRRRLNLTGLVSLLLFPID
jgi:hypothetical protein